MKPIKLILSLVMGVLFLTQTGYSQNGLLYTIAGQQIGLGYSGDGGPALNAELHFITDLERRGR